MGAVVSHGAVTPERRKPLLLRYLSSTDHKEIGIMYLWYVLTMAFVGGGLAGLLRLQLSAANAQILAPNSTTSSCRCTPR